MIRLVCSRCGTDVEWIDKHGTPVPRCPNHPQEKIFRGLRTGETYRAPESRTEPAHGTPRQGELFGDQT